jgi:hypothetical protein
MAISSKPTCELEREVHWTLAATITVTCCHASEIPKEQASPRLVILITDKRAERGLAWRRILEKGQR